MSKQVARCAGLSLTISGPASPAGRGAAPWKNKRKPAKRKPSSGNKRTVKA
jgi:DNA topoisomerase-3